MNEVLLSDCAVRALECLLVHDGLTVERGKLFSFVWEIRFISVSPERDLFKINTTPWVQI